MREINTKNIRGADASAKSAAEKYLQTLAMPPGSLGRLEDIAVQLAGITGQIKNTVEKKRILVFCADNAVVNEGVACAPQSVTAIQAYRMTEYKTGMSAMAHAFGDEVLPVDIGIDHRSGAFKESDYPLKGLLDRHIKNGCENILYKKAMTEDEVKKAIQTGMELAEDAGHDGVKLLGIGEMGIGNTTTSSAVLAALTGNRAGAVTGRGGGLTDEGLAHKIEVIDTALDLHGLKKENDVIKVLSCVGGLDIAGMCGAYLGAAGCRIPVVIDGFISIVAALCAVKICKSVSDFVFPSHLSEEKGYRIAAEELDLRPYLALDMRLGEGSGCVPAFRIIEAACAMINGMGSFEEAGIDDSYLDEVRDK